MKIGKGFGELVLDTNWMVLAMLVFVEWYVSTTLFASRLRLAYHDIFHR